MDERTVASTLFDRWHQGDEKALAELLSRNLLWIEAQVSRRLGAELRGKAETQDFVQDALLEALRYTPRFKVENEAVFRKLLLRIIENVLCDRHDWFTARRREMHRERPLVRDTVLQLDPPVQQVTAAGARAERREYEARVRLALELLDPEERRLVLRREWDGLEFAALGEELGISTDAARMRFHRTLVRLEALVCRIGRGELEQCLDESRGVPE